MRTGNIKVYENYRSETSWNTDVIFTNGAYHEAVDYESDFAVPDTAQNRESIASTGKRHYWSESYARDPNGVTKKWTKVVDVRGKDY